MKKLLGILVMLFWCNVSFALIDAQSYVKGMAGDNKEIHELLEDHLIGIKTGFMWANSALKIQKRKPVYCQPGKLVINGKNLIRFLGKKKPSFSILSLSSLVACCFLEYSFSCSRYCCSFSSSQLDFGLMIVSLPYHFI